MKTKLCLTLLTMISLLALFNTGCPGGTAPETIPEEIPETAPETVPEFTPDIAAARDNCIELLQKIPGSYGSLTLWNAKALREDPELGEIYEIWYDRHVEYLEKDYGIDSRSIDYYADGGLIKFIKISYDPGALGENISLEFYRDTNYEEIEVWKSDQSRRPQGPIGGWVLEEGLVVRGWNNSNIDEYLQAAGGEEPSMYDSDMAALLERLPQGIVTWVSRRSFPAGLAISGMSFEKAGDKTFTWTNTYKFESAGAAGSDAANEYFAEIETGFREGEKEFAKFGNTPYFHGFSLERDGEFVTWRTLIDEQYLIFKFFYD